MRALLMIGCAVLCSSVMFAQDFSKYPITVTNVSAVNSEADDFAPVLYDNTIQFTSSRSTKATSEAVPYISTYAASGWSVPKVNARFIQSTSDGSIAYARLVKTFVFASTSNSKVSKSDIFVSDRSTQATGASLRLSDSVNSSAWDAQPCVSPDGRTIYFVSNRNAANKTDIYVTHKLSNDTWSKAVPLSDVINTAADERTPYVSANGKHLFFARNVGVAGKRNYDLFVSDFVKNVWTEPRRLPEPINSDTDELYFYPGEDDSLFYICSNRAGGNGGLDIYQCTPNIITGGKITLTTCSTDSLTGYKLTTRLKITDVITGAVILDTNTSPCNAQYTLLANREHKITALFRGKEKSVVIPALPEGAETQALFTFITTTFDFSEYTIPFFVSGYYALNTPKGLDDLFKQKELSLKGITYIEQFDKNSPKYEEYKRHSRTVDSIFARVITTAVDTVLPWFYIGSEPNEYLEIRIHGYADPKPIIGRYIENADETYEDTLGTMHTIHKGEVLTNDALSGLRALYSVRFFNDIFLLRSKEYADLVKQNRIVLRAIGGGINSSSTDLAAQRRIRIEFEKKKRVN